MRRSVRFKQKNGMPTISDDYFFVCWFCVFFWGINWSLSVVGFFCSLQLAISLYLTSTTFSWWGRPSWNRLISLIHLSSCNLEMGSPQDLFCLPIGSFSTEPGLWRVRCLLLECHPFKCQSRWGTMGTAPYALVELKQGPNLPNLCREYLLQKLSTWNLNIPTKLDKEKEHPSEPNFSFWDVICILRGVLPHAPHVVLEKHLPIRAELQQTSHLLPIR